MQCSKKQSPCKCTVPFHLVNVKISMQISLKILQSTFVNYILSRVHNYFYCFTTSNSHLSSLYILNPWFTNCFKLTQIVSKITYTWKMYEQFQSNYTNSIVVSMYLRKIVGAVQGIGKLLIIFFWSFLFLVTKWIFIRIQ